MKRTSFYGARAALSLAAGLLLAAFVSATPAYAANCNYHVNPGNQNTPEFDANGNPILITLGLNKAPEAGVVIVWSQVDGPTVTLNTANQAAPTFLTPSVPNAGATLRFRATATCPGIGTGVDEGTVTVSNVNRPPVAYASSAPAIAFQGDLITLRSTAPSGAPASNDPDGDALVYQWTQAAGPPVTLTGANTATASFTAPATGSDYTLQFQLLVRDRPSGGLTNTASVVVNVTSNSPPLAVLQCPERVNEGNPVLLDGRGSNDPNGQSLTYAWSQLQGTPSIAVGGETGNTVAFNAPTLTTGQDGFIEFELKVTDTQGLWDLATCMLEIRDVTRPVISVPTLSPFEAISPAGSPVTFGVTAADNVDGDLSSLVVCVPPSGSIFDLGTTTVDCEVDDSIGNTGEASFFVTVSDTTPPVIDPHNDVAVEATGPGGAVIDYESPGTFDVVDVNLVATCSPLSGGNFGLGSHTVTCNATDYAGNQAVSSTFAATVHDTTPPAFDTGSISPDIVAEATGPEGANVTYPLPTANDLVDLANVTVTCAPPSDSMFELGETTIVRCDAADSRGNSTTEKGLPAQFTVTVQDKTPPAITGVPSDQELEATSAAGAQFAYLLPAANDIVDGVRPVTCTNAPELLTPGTFPLGITTVTCSASDTRGNSSSASFTVTVLDRTPPAISGVSPDLIVEATSGAGALADYAQPTAFDLVDGDVLVTCAAPSGSVFALGAHTVTCSAKDSRNNSASASFTVTVRDTTAPAIAGLVDQILEATSPAGAVATFAPTASDAVDPSVTVSCAPASGSMFALGTHTVNCSATDFSNNTAHGSFTVTVRDTTAPTLTYPAYLTAEATGPNGASVAFNVSASDIVDTEVEVTCSPHSGDTFALGITPVHCTAKDDSGNTATGSFTITVRDTTGPTISPHANVSAIAAGNSTAVVTYDPPTATDLVDGLRPVVCAPASGSVFNVGSTTVACTSQDSRGNPATPTTFTVNVSYAWNGFFKPVDMWPVLNSSKAGSAIPLKFSLGGNQGMSIMAAGYPKSAPMSCGGAVEDPILETVTAGQSSLQYDASANQYIYVWKSEKSWAGTCRQIQVKLIDGTLHTANFSFK